jgi:Ca2+-binding RTX toxin-like protein
MTLKLSLNVGVGVSIVALLAVLIVSSFSKEQAAFALTRGTPYDDLLSSSMTEDSNQNELSFMGTNNTQARPSSNSSSVFIYGDLGNDEIRGSNQSDHLGGGPGSDVIYGYNGGDYIQGGLGIDSLYGGEGDDVLSGSEGADYFDCGEGRDNVDDFEPMEGDFTVGNCEVLENEEKPVAMR